ncbi:hypothetical protein [Paenibacillus darwinianus]|uniref:hypothetical protein n=1 Tax=Paenibacillus darwinianus TaxID=1380763 RepID=UPI000450EC5E|nr:hypothetical protein [Paenibacillus darwinianus]EXX92750.1 hypothetical protein CH50_01325 [Paenibacillus darwinianus]
MERLIAFLLDNFFIIVVIAGFLLSLLGKMGKHGPGRMPDFGGGGQPTRRETWPVNPTPRAGPLSAPPQPQAWETRRPSAELPEDVRPSSHEAPPMRPVGPVRTAEGGDAVRSFKLSSKPAVTSAEALGSPASQALTSIHGFSENADANELRQGLIWAEVLGPPRAKRPFVRGRNG